MDNGGLEEGTPPGKQEQHQNHRRQIHFREGSAEWMPCGKISLGDTGDPSSEGGQEMGCNSWKTIEGINVFTMNAVYSYLSFIKKIAEYVMNGT